MKIHFFFDRRSFLWLLTLLFAVLIVWATFTADQIFFGIFFICISAGALWVFLITPCFYVMTPKGLWIFYFFFLSHEYYLWEKVEKVMVAYDTGRKTPPYIFDTFSIFGESEDKDRFYKKGEIVRTLRARLLIEKYTGKKITGFYMDDFKAWLKERRRRSERKKAHQARMKQARIAQREKARRKEMKNKQKGNRYE